MLAIFATLLLPMSQPDSSIHMSSERTYSCADTMLTAQLQFGCQGDGLHGDTACLQAAIDAAVLCGGKALFLPVGHVQADSATVDPRTRATSRRGGIRLVPWRRKKNKKK